MPFAIDCIVGQTFTNWVIEVSYRASASILGTSVKYYRAYDVSPRFSPRGAVKLECKSLC